MGILQKKRSTTGKTALAYRAKGGQNTDTAFLALRLRVVLDLLLLEETLLLRKVRRLLETPEKFLEPFPF